MLQASNCSAPQAKLESIKAYLFIFNCKINNKKFESQKITKRSTKGGNKTEVAAAKQIDATKSTPNRRLKPYATPRIWKIPNQYVN